MNQKISRKEKHNNSTEENLALDGDEKASTLINIALENGRNIFELLQIL